eukprot:TRINITY_DN4383_c0_g2_i1.p1 TRINITY_DN4383_c0_g2~~TRINITY_DN4383_c0_g2_i1.p1  ORF type:complete len:199 (+),score=-31.80 TRINITY_DN4383_c0_g2_i1:27-599(+)
MQITYSIVTIIVVKQTLQYQSPTFYHRYHITHIISSTAIQNQRISQYTYNLHVQQLKRTEKFPKSPLNHKFKFKHIYIYIYIQTSIQQENYSILQQLIILVSIDRKRNNNKLFEKRKHILTPLNILTFQNVRSPQKLKYKRKYSLNIIKQCCKVLVLQTKIGRILYLSYLCSFFVLIHNRYHMVFHKRTC